MQKYLVAFANQIKLVWNQLEFSQRLTIGLLSFIVLIGLIALGTWGARPDYQVLFSNLDAQDASKIISKLSEGKIPYRITGNGNTIMVPEKNVHETRILLANEGIPRASGVGFELFDNFKLGATDFTQKLNFQRALQTELSRTICQIAGVRQARIHIAFPDEELYSDYKNPTTASIILDLAGATELNQNQINGIVHLVSRAVKGLKPENVTVIDTNGNLLYQKDASMSDSSIAQGNTQIEAKRNYEKELETRLQSMLQEVLGPNKSVVRVAAELNYDTEKIDSEIYEPSDTPIVRSSKVTEESFAGQGAGASAGLNVQSGQGSNYTKTEEVNNYEVTKHIKSTVSAVGKVKKLSVAIILDRKIDDAAQKAIMETAKAAAGIETERGDTLVVKTMEFNRKMLEDAKKEMAKAEKTELYMKVGQGAGIAVGVIILLLFLRSAFRSANQLGQGGSLEMSTTTPGGVMLDLSAQAAAVANAAGGETELEQQLRILATQQPDDFIRTLRDWLSE